MAAHAALTSRVSSEMLVGLASDRLIADREAAILLLRRRYLGGPRERAWALVLLARLGEVNNVEAIHRPASRIDLELVGEEERKIRDVQIDYFYAIPARRS